MIGGKQRNCPVIWSKNYNLKPHWVTVEGKDEEHHEGSYYLDWRENGRRVRVSVGNDPVLAANRYKRQRAILTGVEVAPLTPKGAMLLVDAVSIYLTEVKEQKKPKTYAAYKTALDYFLESCKSSHKQLLHEIDRKDLLNYSTFLRVKKGLEPRTVYNKFESVMSFLKAQKIVGLAQKNDWPQFTEEEVDVYEREELDRFFAACTREEKLYFEFFLMTGMREQEVMYSTWRNVNFAENTIAVRHNPQFVWTPKAYKEREIPIPSRLMASLKTWKAKADPKCPLIFPTKGCRPKFDFLDVCKMVALRAGLEGDFYLHKFRATFCTWALWGGVDFRTCQAWMGHSDMESTMRYLKPNRNAAVRAKIEAVFA